MENTAAEDLEGPGYIRRADLRYRGQSFELTVGADALEKLEERFHASHEQRYGYRMEDESVDLVNLRLIATVPVEKPKIEERIPRAMSKPGVGRRTSTGSGGRRRSWTAKRWVRARR